MRLLANAFLLVAIPVLLGFGPMATQAETATPMQGWSFDHEEPGVLFRQFSIGTIFDGRPVGERQNLATDRAKSPPHVFAQLISKGAEPAYNVALIKVVIAVA
jgi:hypothetical protein